MLRAENQTKKKPNKTKPKQKRNQTKKKPNKKETEFIKPRKIPTSSLINCTNFKTYVTLPHISSLHLLQFVFRLGQTKTLRLTHNLKLLYDLDGRSFMFLQQKVTCRGTWQQKVTCRDTWQQKVLPPKLQIGVHGSKACCHQSYK